MEEFILAELIGIWIIYTWIHAVIIISKKLPELPTYEKFISWTALISLAFLVLNYITE